MIQLIPMRTPAALVAALACAAMLGCGSRAPADGDRSRQASGRAIQAPDVARHLAGLWWRAHRGRTQGLHLHPDGKLDLVGVPPLRGLGWRVDGRRLVLRMRAERTGDLFEDELFLRRLTDRTLVAEAGDSYFAGTYKRRRDDVLAAPPGGEDERRPPSPASREAAPAGASRTLEEPIVLRRIAAAELPEREAWVGMVADLSACPQGLNSNECPRFYVDREQSLLLVEICRPGGVLDVGVHVVDVGGRIASYPWFDASFGRFACEYGCNGPDSCRYEVTATSPTGRPTEVVYRFDIGPSWGWVRLQFGPAGAVRVVEHKVSRPQ